MPLDANHATGVVYQEERFTDLRHEGAHLFAKHWREATADAAVPLDLDWDRYRLMEDAGFMCTMTVRSAADRSLLGYVVYIIWPHLHYRRLVVAETDSFFVDPAAARGWVGVDLFRRSEALLRQRGVHHAWARVKLHVLRGRARRHNLLALFLWLGYQPVEMVLRKRLV